MTRFPTRPLARLMAVGLLSLAALAAPAGASASCALPPPGADPWASADAVFVGTVTSVANFERWATVEVEEVWKGPDQPAVVVVRGGPEGNTATSVDRTYAVGMKYVFGVLVSDGNLHDNSCSSTAPADAVDLDALRPADARAPIGGTIKPNEDAIDLGAFAGPVAVVGVVGGLLVLTVMLARRRDA